MNKKVYIAPAIKEIELEMSHIICASVKGGGAASDIGWGGDGTNQEAGSREYSGWGLTDDTEEE